jgi:S1-C subfamily serine protease
MAEAVERPARVPSWWASGLKQGRQGGVQQGDLILEVNRQNVSSTGELKQLLARHQGGDVISLLVQRANAGMMVLKLA